MRFDQLLEKVPEGIADDRVLRINAEFPRLFGYAPDEATGHLLTDLVRPEAVEDQAFSCRSCRCLSPTQY
jgi:PAS domain-containing protein